jgi:hypothetical protein
MNEDLLAIHAAIERYMAAVHVLRSVQARGLHTSAAEESVTSTKAAADEAIRSYAMWQAFDAMEKDFSK